MSACNAGDLGSIPGSGRSPGEGNGICIISALSIFTFNSFFNDLFHLFCATLWHLGSKVMLPWTFVLQSLFLKQLLQFLASVCFHKG